MGFVLEEVNRIERLVADLLDYVRPDHFERHRIDLLAEVVQPAWISPAPALPPRHQPRADRAGRAAAGQWDVDRLYQALLNLLLNAADAPRRAGMSLSG